jgi:hypothetical protein
MITLLFAGTIGIILVLGSIIFSVYAYTLLTQNDAFLSLAGAVSLFFIAIVMIICFSLGANMLYKIWKARDEYQS